MSPLIPTSQQNNIQTILSSPPHPKGSMPKRKCPKLWKKSIIFLTPPPPRIMWTFLNLGKN